MLAGESWPTWEEFESVGYDIRQLSNFESVTDEILSFYNWRDVNNKTLLFDIENSSVDSNITLTLSATFGHPPYQYAFRYVSGTYDSGLSSFTPTVTYTADKTLAQANYDTKIYFNFP